jgi:putative membrane protein
MKNRYTTLAAALLLAVGLAACKTEETTVTETGSTAATETYATDTVATDTTATTPTTGSLSAEDNDFVSKAAMGGLAEVQYGNLALQKAASADVKSFAQKMVTDHGAANQELQTIATAKGVTLPTELTGTHKAGFDHLNMLSGAEFDKAYMQHMVADHEKDVAEFEKASTSAVDSEVKAFAAKTLPTLQQHKQLADETSKKVQ